MGNDTLPGQQTRSGSKALLIKGGSFRIQTALLNSRLRHCCITCAALNDETAAGSDFSASYACNSVFSSLTLGLYSATSSFLPPSIDSLIMRFGSIFFSGYSQFRSCTLFALLIEPPWGSSSLAPHKIEPWF